MPKARKKAPVGNERRGAPRVKLNLPARWEGDRGRQEANVTSLSKVGCFVLSGGKVALRELIRLELLFAEEESIYIWAKVVDVAEEIGFALQFTSLEAADELKLLQLIEVLQDEK